MIKMRPIIPKDIAFDPAKLRRAIKNGMEGASKGVKVDYGVTTQTWEGKPEFTIERPSDFERIISTDDKVFAYVDKGTQPHVIVARSAKVLTFLAGGRAKTVPRAIRSNKGSTGNTIVYTKRVQHPGNAPREFTETIGEKWEQKLPEILQRAIDSEVR